MHTNLRKVQDELMLNVSDNLKTLEVSDRKPLILSVLWLAEKPLTETEIITRAGLKASEVKKALKYFTAKSVISRTTEKQGAAYELNRDLETVLAGNVQEKIKALQVTTKKHVRACEELLESSEEEFDAYDRLMAKFLREKIGRLKILAAFLTKRNTLFQLLDAGEDPMKIEKITIA